MLVLVMSVEGRYEEALKELAEVRRLEGGGSSLTAAQEAYVMARAGRKEEALERVGEIKKFSAKTGVEPHFFMAMIHMGFGDKEEALKALDNSRHLSIWMAFAAVDPLLDPLHSDPRFHEILRKMGLRK